MLLAFPFYHLIGQKKQVKSVSIGKQKWMSVNLDVVNFQNGDQIPEAKSDEEWISAGENKQPAWCIDPVPSYDGQNGRLYNWYAVNDHRNICPVGYHVATDSDWENLTVFLGGEDIAGGKLKSKSGWPNSGNGTNETGFSGIPGAVRIKDGIFSPQNSSAVWWSSTQYDNEYAYYRSLYFSSNQFTRKTFNKTYGCYVRCVKD
jgi:uncharacterized protein (TIGR02145 family)